jgi:hypothetical protein
MNVMGSNRSNAESQNHSVNGSGTSTGSELPLRVPMGTRQLNDLSEKTTPLTSRY